MQPNPYDVAAFLGKPADAALIELAASHLGVVQTMVRRYVHGRGFDVDGFPDDDLAAVIVASCARSVSNPRHDVTSAIDDYSLRHGIFNGWTLPELAVLHSYRRRAA